VPKVKYYISNCVSVTLAMQHAVRMRSIVLSPVNCTHVATLSHKQHD